ncbi:MAG: HhH-GPD-type base excision DNA repair protein [Aquihabitans sp.]
MLVTDPLALLLGMLLDQQVPMTWAFRSPSTIKLRLGDRWSPDGIASMDPEELVEIFCEKPAVHRYPAAMARRAHAVAVHIVDCHGGDTADIWMGARSGAGLYQRVSVLPGFGEEKSQIFVALLAKRFGVKPRGWKAAAGAFSDRQPRSAADVDSTIRLREVQAWKKAQKAAKKSKAEFSLPT